MLIDAVTFFNELDLLEVRMDYLNNIVDYFVIVEAGKTQTLLDKPYYYEENKERYKKYWHKIIHIKVEDYPDSPGWAMENFQRNAILRGLIKFRGDDLVMISDLDEIPNRDAIARQMLLSSIHLNTISVSHTYHAYYVNLFSPSKRWYGTILSNVNTVRSQSPQSLRNNKDYMEHLEGGWHFGWLGQWEKVRDKLLSCIEPFDKKALKFDELEKMYKANACDGGYFIHSENPYDTSVKLIRYPLELLPENILTNQEKYKHLILP